MSPTRVDLVGLREIAERYGLSYAAVRNRRLRGSLPEPDWMISGAPVWRAQTIDQWAQLDGLEAVDSS